MRKPKLSKKRGVKLVFGLVFGVVVFTATLGLRGALAAVSYEDSKAVINPELSIAAQGAKRASDFLNWSFDLTKPTTSKGTLGETTPPTANSIKKTLQNLWLLTFELVIIVYVAIIIVLAFGYIFHASWLVRWRRYIPWLAISAAAAALSFVISVFAINIVDLAVVGIAKINAINLINIVGDYDTFAKLKSTPDIDGAEIINNTIFLIKALTYTAYAIGGILVIRTIVLWMMVVFVPLIFPFIAFPVTQSLTVVWVREFARWLLYGVLVALFLYASNQFFKAITSTSITTNGNPSPNYGTATNVTLELPNTSAGAGIGAGTNGGATTDVKDANTYSQYLTSIILLWASIILPWFLLRFGINFVSKSSSGWYERTVTSPRIQQIIRALSPPGRLKEETAARPVAQAPLLSDLTTPARKLHVSPIVARPTVEAETKLREVTPSAEPSFAPSELRKGRDEARRIEHEEFPQAQSATGTIFEKLGSVTAPSAIHETAATPLAGYEPTPARQGLPFEQTPEEAKQMPFEPALYTSVSPVGAMQVAGLDKLTAAISQLEHGRKINEPLATLTRLEQKPSVIAQATGELNEINNPQTINQTTKKNTLVELKNRIMSDPANPQNKGIAAALQKDSSQIVTQNLRREIRQKNMLDVKEKAEKLLETHNLSESTQNQLNEFVNNINQYQSTSPAKATKQQLLAHKIEQFTNAIIGNKSQEQGRGAAPALSNMPVNSTASRAAKEINDAKSKEGDNLLDSMDMLHIGEIASVSAGDNLAQENFDPVNTIADKKTTQDYEFTKKQWVDYYSKTPVPTSDKIKDRADWLEAQIKEQTELLKRVTSINIEERKKAIDELSNLMPFLLMGDYSLLEVSMYLKAKISAAQEVLKKEKSSHSESSEESHDNVISNDSEKSPTIHFEGAPPAGGATEKSSSRNSQPPTDNNQQSPQSLSSSMYQNQSKPEPIKPLDASQIEVEEKPQSFQ